MENFGWLAIGFIVAMAIVSTVAGFVISTKGKTNGAILFGLCSLALFGGALVISFVISPSSPASNIGTTGKDFYQVVWEGKTTNGKTVVIVQDSLEKFYVSEFNEPLGVEKVLVIEKDKFRPLLPEEPAQNQIPQK